MNTWLEIPLTFRTLLVFLLGTVLGGLVNWAVYSLCYQPRPTSPWSRSHPKDSDDRWLDRLPLWGWWRLRRKGKLLGYEFWLRPLLVEVVSGALLAGLYWWEIDELGVVFRPIPEHITMIAPLLPDLHAIVAGHCLLAIFMLAATFIDLDEQTIPDEITVPGTLLGLLWMTLVPAAALPENVDWQSFRLIPMHLASPDAWPPVLNGRPEMTSLAYGLGCYFFWCLALLPRRWRSGHGWRRACGLLLAGIARARYSKVIAVLAAGGGLAIAGCWSIGGAHWQNMLSALVGLAGGVALVWAVRLIGAWALGREAMGFGDVTLLGMIGVFLGWQAALLVFFFAPFLGIAMGVIQLAINRRHEMPYGPFLCLSALGVIVSWPRLWDRTSQTFAVPWLVPGFVAVCLVGMFVMLLAWGMLKRLLFGRR
ncbi:MAG TPA: A24 family peptidase [Pirellulales bacterium]|nr:A24 family peptidase [Pirellulales bacterium]